MASNPEQPDTELLLAGPDSVTGGNAPDGAEIPEFHNLPKDIGVMLLSAGVVGFVTPGPGAPAIVVGGLILWPNGFGKAEGWFRRRFPSVHSGGMRHIRRFLNDLERRYPGSLR